VILLLDAAAADAPARTAVVSAEGTPTYDELRRDAGRVAAALRRRGITRFAVAEPDAGWVVRLLAGAALAGAEPCQFQPDLEARELAAQATALGHGVVVTRRTGFGASLEAVHPVALTEVDADDGVDREAGEPQPLLIRTTGTTGLPKAARHDWRVLAQTVAGLRPAPDQRWLLAYGLQQFAGIQVLLHVIASQATLVAPFPRQPRDGLDALLHDGVTCVSATPTFWRFLLAEARSRKVTLPPLQQVTLGGEASTADLLGELRAAFPTARVSQVYASTELGSVTSVRDGRPGFSVDALHGASNPTGNLRVQEGELWVRAAAGMLGYAGESAGVGVGAGDGEVAHTATETGAPAWHPTGDLVEIVDDRVMFRGRSSDVINVGGVKVHPLPVEERIASLPDVAAARVYGRPSKMTGAIVAVEVVPACGLSSADAERLRLAVKEVVSDLPRAWHPRSVSLVDAIATRGGKTVRGGTG
jgi:acyl-CoA synthetase (AMP-forming)/AMP-acid ligase II